MAKGKKGSSPIDEDKPKRTSFNILPSTKRKVDYISLMDRKDLTDIVEEGLQHIIAQYEKKNGPIPIR